MMNNSQDIFNTYNDIDITDKTILQEQFNYARKIYFDCIQAIESINKKIAELKESLSDITINLYRDSDITSTKANTILKGDEEYQRTLVEISCYENSIKILEEKINFVKSDIRILSNSMYNKF